MLCWCVFFIDVTAVRNRGMILTSFLDYLSELYMLYYQFALAPVLQPVDIKSRWRHNWKSAQVVNSHLVCDPTIRQPGFDLPRQQWSLLNRFRTKQGHCTAVPAEGNGILHTLICVPVERSRRCPTLSNPVP